MKLICFSFLVVFLASCSGSSLSKKLNGSDSLVVQFNTPGTQLIEKTISTTNHNAIRELAGFVDGKESEKYKCGYDGNLLFYKKGSLDADISFNYGREGCRHFIMINGDSLKATRMSNKAADFLKGLARGQSWY
jgi:hypothetical protein